ncbi:Peptidyl-prolyl cis-trans isomerase, partial [Zea mays]
MIQGGDFQQNN